MLVIDNAYAYRRTYCRQLYSIYASPYNYVFKSAFNYPAGELSAVSGGDWSSFSQQLGAPNNTCGIVTSGFCENIRGGFAADYNRPTAQVFTDPTKGWEIDATLWFPALGGNGVEFSFMAEGARVNTAGSYNQGYIFQFGFETNTNSFTMLGHDYLGSLLFNQFVNVGLGAGIVQPLTEYKVQVICGKAVGVGAAMRRNVDIFFGGVKQKSLTFSQNPGNVNDRFGIQSTRDGTGHVNVKCKGVTFKGVGA